MDIDALIGKVRDLKKGKGFKKASPLAEFKLNYDAFAETLEPVYFWLLDFMQGKGGSGMGMEVEKLVDNFAASPGGGYFADIGIRATRMQEQGMKILATINTVMRSILNLIYDLKEFEIRLKHYDALKSKDKKEKEAGLLALKQIWMDRVDIRRGTGSINMLTAQLDFVTLRDAFMKAQSPEDVDKMDLNERVKRILKPRLAEFFEWVKRSERELRNRYELQKTYLKSQVNAIKLYTRWVKPYLRAAEELRMMETGLRRPELVNAFNTIILELTLFGRSKIDINTIRKAISKKEFPQSFWNVRLRQNYYACLFIDLLFRGLPRIISRGEGSHYVHSGRVSLVLKAYALNDDELNLLRKEIEKQEIYEGLRLIERLTSETLEPIYEDLVRYMAEEKKDEKEKIKEKKSFFEWLFGGEKTKKEEKIRKETFVEKQIRKMIAEPTAIGIAWKVYDTFKKAHGMPSPVFDFVSRPGE